MMPRVSTSFRIDAEEGNWLRSILEGVGFRLGKQPFESFVQTIESEIDWFLKTKDADSVTFREKHEAMRELFFLAQDGLYDPNERASAIETLRSMIESLPEPILAELDRLGSLIITHLSTSWPAVPRGPSAVRKGPPGEVWQPQSWAEMGGFRIWARNAEDEKLLRATQAMTAHGVVVVSGRRRGEGKRSRPRIEPYVMGVARGKPDDERRKGGRPNQAITFIFICALANAWERATGAFPQPGRSDHTGFGDLIHQVFAWLDDPASAENSLRYFWKEMKKYEPASGGTGT